MGVLKTLTDEYFEKSIRTEEGKYLEIKGCKLIVPTDFDEKKYLSLIHEIVDNEDDYGYNNCSEFLRQRDIRNSDYKIHCDGDMYFTLDVKKIKENLSYSIDDSHFEYCLKFIEYLLNGVSLDIYNGKTYVVLADEYDLFNKFDCEIHDENLDEWSSQECWNYLTEWFIEEFGKKADIVEKDLHYIHYYNDSLNIMISNEYNSIEWGVFLHAKEMQEWWKDKLNKIKKIGAREFFGYEPEDENEEE